MTNFIFKSPGTYKKLANNLEVILNEQRHQRQDLAAILYILKMIRNDFKLSGSTAEFLDQDIASDVDTETDQ